MGRRDGVSRILVVELWHIGDVVLTVPFLAQLRALYPGAEISLLARGYARELLAEMGLVDEFIETDLAWDASGGFNPFRYRWRELLRVTRTLRRRNFDIAFQCRPHVREQVLLALSGAHQRIGLAFGIGDRFLSHAVRIENPDTRKIDQWRALLAPLGGPTKVETPTLQVSETEQQWAREFLAEKGFTPGEALVAIHPGASEVENRWPLERFREVAKALGSRPGVRVLTFVDPAGYGATLSDVPGVIAAKVGLRQLMALIQKSVFLICNDSGPMHIAGALGVPTIATFRLINQWYLPLGEGHEQVRADNVAAIPVSRIMEAADRKLREIGGAVQGDRR